MPSDSVGFAHRVEYSQVCSLQEIEYSTIAFVPGNVAQIAKGFSPDNQHSPLINQHRGLRLDTQTHTTLIPFFDDQTHPRRQTQATLHRRWYQDTSHII